jgi:hypothetical protein
MDFGFMTLFRIHRLAPLVKATYDWTLLTHSLKALRL